MSDRFLEHDYYQSDLTKGVIIKFYYYDNKNIVEKLSEGNFYSKSYFSNNIIEKMVKTIKVDVPIMKQDEENQYQLYHEELQQIGYNFDKVEGLCLKTEQLSIQSRIKKYREKGKSSVMKEIRNLAEKNDCFKEVIYRRLIEEMKKRSMPILIFIMAKRNGIIKSRGIAHSRYQHSYMSKEKYSSLTPDFYAFKFVCMVIAKEERDAVSADLPEFFL